MNDLSVFADILLPALVAGLLVISTHIPLGFKVLSRGIIFMDLAIAQVAGLGALLITVLVGEQASPLVTQLGAVTLALAAALLLHRGEQLTARYQEPLIGTLFVLAATAGILVLAGDPHAGEHMTDLLSGQILWVSHEQLITSGWCVPGLCLADHSSPEHGSDPSPEAPSAGGLWVGDRRLSTRAEQLGAARSTHRTDDCLDAGALRRHHGHRGKKATVLFCVNNPLHIPALSAATAASWA